VHNTVTSTASAETQRAFCDDVIAGLYASRKHLPCRLLYDARGAALFERICALEEYYPTRSELGLLVEHLPALGRVVGPSARVVEPGSGAGVKTRMLLYALDSPVGYVPIDISRDQLEDNARALRSERPLLEVQPVCADYMARFDLPTPARAPRRTLAFFPGSSIGNFEPDEARMFLSRLAELAGPGGMLLLGVDANRDRRSLERAYDDSQGVTSAFNKNVLAHLNRTHRATFDLDSFVHRAVWNASHHRIEMHLVSVRAQAVRIGDGTIRLERGESIVTEHCYKHPPPVLASMLSDAGWRTDRVGIDPLGRMRLLFATRA
jgi:dimethylhistidine N-methyltransferase